jgi:hypothetical protein
MLCKAVARSSAAIITLTILNGVSCSGIHYKPSPWMKSDVAHVSTAPAYYLGRQVDARGNPSSGGRTGR